MGFCSVCVCATIFPPNKSFMSLYDVRSGCCLSYKCPLRFFFGQPHFLTRLLWLVEDMSCDARYIGVVGCLLLASLTLWISECSAIMGQEILGTVVQSCIAVLPLRAVLGSNHSPEVWPIWWQSFCFFTTSSPQLLQHAPLLRSLVATLGSWSYVWTHTLWQSP